MCIRILDLFLVFLQEGERGWGKENKVKIEEKGSQEKENRDRKLGEGNKENEFMFIKGGKLFKFVRGK